MSIQLQFERDEVKDWLSITGREATLKGTNTQRSGHMGHKGQTQLMVEIYSKGLVRAIGKV